MQVGFQPVRYTSLPKIGLVRFKQSGLPTFGLKKTKPEAGPKKKKESSWEWEDVVMVGKMYGAGMLGNVLTLHGLLLQPPFRYIPGIRAVQRKFEKIAIFHPKGKSDLQALKSEKLKNLIREEYIPVEGPKKGKAHLIHTWYLPPKNGKPTVVYAHGNFGNMNLREQILEYFEKNDLGAQLFDYSGYGCSEGKVSEPQAYRDLKAVVKHVEKKHQIPINEQILMGESLGGGVVVDVAQDKEFLKGKRFQMVSLVATFTSIPDVFQNIVDKGISSFPGIRRVPWLGQRFFCPPKLMEYQFLSKEKIKNVESPLFVIHGEKDWLMPFKLAQELVDNAVRVPKDKEGNRLIKVLPIKEADHFNLFEKAMEHGAQIAGEFHKFRARILGLKDHIDAQFKKQNPAQFRRLNQIKKLASN